MLNVQSKSKLIDLTAFIGYEDSLKWLNNEEEGIGIMGVRAVVGKGEGEEKEEDSDIGVGGHFLQRKNKRERYSRSRESD